MNSAGDTIAFALDQKTVLISWFFILYLQRYLNILKNKLN